MHENAPILQAKPRERLGSRYSQRIREAGGLPAVVYGRGKDPVPVTLEAREAIRHIQSGEKVFRLDLPGTKDKDEGQIVLLKDIQFDYLGTNIVHADLRRVSLTDRVTVRVPVHLLGEAKGLKSAGAILMHPTNEIEIECQVTEIPDFVEVRVDELDVGHAITAADVKLPKASMKLVTDVHSIVAQIVIQQELKVEEAVAVTAEAAGPEVITAKKKEGEEGAAAPGAPGAKPAAGAAKPGAPAAGAKPGAPAAGAKPAAGGAKPAGGGAPKK
jgi:large subunit ribosomal protein L25